MKLKLIKGRSYNATGVKVTAKEPVFETADKKLAERLVKGGHFVIIPEIENNNSSDEKEIKEIKEKTIDKMTEAELDKYAKEKGVDLTGLTKKAEKLAKIQEFLKTTDGDNDNTVDFGEE